MARLNLSIRLHKITLLTLFAMSAPASAQLLARLPLPALPVRDLAVPLVGEVGGITARIDAVAGLLRAHPRVLERGGRGEVVVRGEVLALAPSPAALDAAKGAGFAIVGDDTDALGLRLVTLRSQSGLGARAALKRLRKLDPAGIYEYNHIFLPGGATGVLLAPGPAGDAPDARIGLVDTGVAGDHPAFAGARLRLRGFAGAIRPAAHGTAVASLLVGPEGAARGGLLFAGDVYGGAPTGGNARSIAAAFGWLAGERVGVVNVSLVGPANAILKAAVDALRQRGTLVVAAVGNDGPAAKPLFPAAYPGVVAVTAVDARGRLLPEAGRAEHTDFAALGTLRAAGLGGGMAAVRGTSFAAPLVAGRLARLHPVANATSAGLAIDTLARDGIAAPRR